MCARETRRFNGREKLYEEEKSIENEFDNSFTAINLHYE